MITRVVIVLVVLFSALVGGRWFGQLWRDPPNTAALEDPSVDLGFVSDAETVSHTLRFVNHSQTPVSITRATSSCGCLKFADSRINEKLPFTMPAGSEWRVQLSPTTRALKGRQHAQTYFFTSGTDPAFIADIVWTVIPSVVATPAIVSLGTCRPGEQISRSCTILRPPGSAPFEPGRIDVSHPDIFAVQVVGNTIDALRHRPFVPVCELRVIAQVPSDGELQEVDARFVVHDRDEERSVTVKVTGNVLHPIRFTPRKAVVLHESPESEATVTLECRLAPALSLETLTVVSKTQGVLEVQIYDQKQALRQVRITCAPPRESEPEHQEIRFRIAGKEVAYPFMNARRYD